MNGIRDRRSSLTFLHLRTQREEGCPWTRKGDLTRHEIYLSPSRNVRNKFLRTRSLWVYGILSWQPGRKNFLKWESCLPLPLSPWLPSSHSILEFGQHWSGHCWHASQVPFHPFPRLPWLLPATPHPTHILAFSMLSATDFLWPDILAPSDLLGWVL